MARPQHLLTFLQLLSITVEKFKNLLQRVCSQSEVLGADGPNTVVFELEGANADFHVVSDYHISIRPEGDMTSGVGTGPHVIEDFNPGVHSKLNRNPNYFKSDRAHFDRIEMTSIIDTTARQNAIMNGDVDCADMVAYNTISLLKWSPVLRLTRQLAPHTFPMRLDVDPFSNYDLRMAPSRPLNAKSLLTRSFWVMVWLAMTIRFLRTRLSMPMPFLSVSLILKRRHSITRNLATLVPFSICS